ncbi:aminopeptidase N [Demequina sp. SYSU T00068]|uniref:aminopeptidase N n=1 Tax=Demequina lignilytica TaxID=3051663 RepID=UPI0026256D70|nr:aminopeptidase N [Demequina sp. SYSU T00068]MDN4490948.1 aminopeptidase N [Demequina sp. SYSU T00068]
MPGLNLTKAEAVERAATVANVSYRVDLDFTATADTFRSDTVVEFDAVDGASTFIEAAGARIDLIELNWEALDPVLHAEGRIVLAPLRARNTLRVAGDFAYRNDGQGIHRFVDPADGEVYLYSQFAANDARAAFACFDQPDLKAPFTFTVTVPDHWVVVSNSPTPEPEPLDGLATVADADHGTARWSFGPTAPIPTYGAAVVAGPYAFHEGLLHSAKGDVPARVYGRRELEEHFDAERVLADTQAGLDLYERVFRTDYPYEKYDQIYVPQYNLGAMENIGCVTISEDRLLFRGRASAANLEFRTVVVLHELAHMWFGNLVTMRWWDDLWLNESFAEFIGTWAAAEVSEWTDAWVTFAADRKSVAYVQDQLPTTHAIVTEVPDTEATVSAFDMITYAKGASALKQLAEQVGEAVFFRGVASYLKRYRHGNATLAEFLAEVEQAADRPLDAWARVWLETPGVTTLRAIVMEDDAGRISRLAIAEDVPAEHPVGRPHRVRVAGYLLGEEGLHRSWSVDAGLDGELTEVGAAVGLAAPDLLLVNDQDLSYAKLHLDDRSLETLRDGIGAIDEPMVQATVLDALWHMVRDGSLPAQVYVDAVLTLLPRLRNSATAESHVRLTVFALTRYVAPELTLPLTEAAAERMWAALAGAAPGGDPQLQLLKAYAWFATTPDQGERLRALVDGSAELEGLPLDSDLRWDLVAGMAASGAATLEQVDVYAARDVTSAGQRRAAGARAAIASPDAKRAAWDALGHPATGPATNAVQFELAAGLARAVDPRLLVPLLDDLLAGLRGYYDANAGFVGARVVKAVLPTALTGRVDGIAERLETWLTANADAPSVLRKAVIEALDHVRRAAVAQAVSRSAR